MLSSIAGAQQVLLLDCFSTLYGAILLLSFPPYHDRKLHQDVGFIIFTQQENQTATHASPQATIQLCWVGILLTSPGRQAAWLRL